MILNQGFHKNNRRTKLIKRLGYGFRNFSNFRLRSLL